MSQPTIRNVVFDIGNVLVRWHPVGIVGAAFGLSGDAAEARRDQLFVSTDIWRALNRGELTQAEAMAAYVSQGHLTATEADALFAAIYASLEPLAETPPLMQRLSGAGYRLFALTDNVREIVSHLSALHDWWAMFEAVTNSAEVGVLKPDPGIYRHLLETNRLAPDETVFLDDVPGNVAGAQAMGMHGIVFADAAQAERDLRSLGVTG